jgi:hypothetical protein
MRLALNALTDAKRRLGFKNWLLYSRVLFFFWRHSPQWVRASSFTRFIDHTQRRSTVGRTPLDEWLARLRDLYMTTHNIHNRHTYTPVGFEPTISAGERQHTYDLDCTATGTSHIGDLESGNITGLWSKGLNSISESIILVPFISHGQYTEYRGLFNCSVSSDLKTALQFPIYSLKLVGNKRHSSRSKWSFTWRTHHSNNNITENSLLIVYGWLSCIDSK